LSNTLAPLVTIIVVTYNSRQWLARQRVALDTQRERRWRLLVVDNASRGEERPEPSDLPVNAQLIQSERNLGFAGANNLAAKLAATPFLAFLNPDAFPEPDWLSRLIDLAERLPGAGAVGSRQLSADDPDLLDGVGDVMHASGIAYRSGYRQRRPTPALSEAFSTCAAAMLVRRDAFESIGGFDDRYFCYFEDVDLGFRLRLKGYRIVQCPDAVAFHVGGGSAGTRSPFAEFHGARNRLWTFVKCMPSALFWPLLPAHLAASVMLSLVAVARGRGPHACRGLLSGALNLGPIWQSRRELQRTRRASVGDIATALAWSPDVFFTRRPVHRDVHEGATRIVQSG
jgi:N-acetylglucosaminyl-diphospho-decaprenol L-rhamnosyltransferase